MRITQIKCKKILDSRGKETIEIKLTLDNKFEGKASVPMGKSVGSYEAISLDFEKINEILPSFLLEIQKLEFENQKDLDEYLIQKAGLRKEKLSANFTLGISIAFARALAEKKEKELFQCLKEEFNLTNEIIFPKLVINTIGGGVHSFNNLNFQEYWIVSKERFSDQLISKILKVIKELEKILPKPLGRNDEGALSTNFKNNLEPIKFLREVIDDDFELGIDCAGNEVNLPTEELFQIYFELEKLEVKYLEDPFKEDDFDLFRKLKENTKIKLIGDDLTVTNKERLKIALEKKSIDGVIVKPNQIGTILETFEFVKLAKENNLFTIFSHRSGETNDYWIVDLGLAFNADFLKIGSPFQGERTAKYNRLLEIFSY